MGSITVAALKLCCFALFSQMVVSGALGTRLFPSAPISSMPIPLALKATARVGYIHSGLAVNKARVDRLWQSATVKGLNDVLCPYLLSVASHCDASNSGYPLLAQTIKEVRVSFIYQFCFGNDSLAAVEGAVGSYSDAKVG